MASSPCDMWRVRWTARFRRNARALGLWSDVRRVLRELERSLNDPKEYDMTLSRLTRAPIVGYTVYRGRRYSLRRWYFGRRTARGFFVLRRDICRVWFVDLVPRTNGLYRTRRW